MRLRVKYRGKDGFLSESKEIHEAFLINISRGGYVTEDKAYLIDDEGKIFMIDPNKIISGEWVK